MASTFKTSEGKYAQKKSKASKRVLQENSDQYARSQKRGDYFYYMLGVRRSTIEEMILKLNLKMNMDSSGIKNGN